MVKEECMEQKKDSQTLGINVTKIVKYVCISAVLIVGIIFGSMCVKEKK